MRRFLIALAAGLGLAAVLVAALPWLAAPALRAGLRLAAPDVAFDRLRLGWHDLELEGLALGAADQEVARLRVSYRLPDLLAGRLERVEIEGLVVRAVWRDGRLHFAGIEAGDRAAGPQALPIPDVEQAVLRDARLELETPLGTLRLPFAAQMQARGERLAFAVTIADAGLAGVGGLSASGRLAGDVPRAAPLALNEARLQGDIAVLGAGASIGGVQDIAGEATVAFDLAGNGARGNLDFALSEFGCVTEALTLEGVSLGQRLDWRYADATLILQASEPGAVSIASMAMPDLHAGPLRLRLEPADRPLLELVQGEEATWRQHLVVGIESLEAHLAAPTPLRLQSEAGTITLTAAGAGTLEEAEAVLAGGALSLPEQALRLEGVAAEVALNAAGLVSERAVPITVERISHAGQPPWFAPLALQAELVPGAAGIAFQGAATRIGGGLDLQVRGSSKEGGGRATLELAPVAFGPGLQPRDLAPVAAGLVSDVVGEIALNGDLAWSPAGLTSDLAVLVDQVGLSRGPARLEQVNGVVRLDGLWPPTTPPNQQLAIGLLDLGLPLTAGIATFQLRAGPRLEVEELGWRLAGGTARAEPFSLGSPFGSFSTTLRAEQLDLGQLLALTRLDGLSGEGSLDGVLPLRLADGVAIIEGGRLAARGPGVLRYAAAAAPAALRAGGEGVDLLLQALENFHYEALEITLDGRTDAAMDIALHIAGANPDLYDGHPVEFNLDLEGELANILRRGVASWQIPERIRERMQGFGR